MKNNQGFFYINDIDYLRKKDSTPRGKVFCLDSASEMKIR